MQKYFVGPIPSPQPQEVTGRSEADKPSDTSKAIYDYDASKELGGGVPKQSECTGLFCLIHGSSSSSTTHLKSVVWDPSKA